MGKWNVTGFSFEPNNQADPFNKTDPIKRGLVYSILQKNPNAD